jgi:hypothetical protein
VPNEDGARIIQVSAWKHPGIIRGTQKVDSMPAPTEEALLERARRHAQRGHAATIPTKRLSEISASHVRHGVTIITPRLLAVPLHSCCGIAESLQQRMEGGKTLIWNLEDEVPRDASTKGKPSLGVSPVLPIYPH